MKEEIYDLASAVTTDIIDTLKDGNLIKNILELSEDTFDTAVPGVKLAFSITHKVREKRFKSFLIGYSNLQKSENYDTTRLVNKLVDASKKEIYIDFISNTYESAIQAKSIKNTAVLGYNLGLKVLQDKQISLDDLIIINGLKELTDLETKIFLDIFNKVDWGSFVNGNKIQDSKYQAYDIQLTIEQLKSLRLVARGHGSFEETEQFGCCKFTQTTIAFQNILYESKVYEDEIKQSLEL